MAKEKKEKEGNIDSVKLAAQSFFKNNRKDIYSDFDEPYKVSTGIMVLDAMLEGGVCSGTLVRLLGPSRGGKSSEGLLIIKNFLESRPRSRALIIPTEARLTEKLRGRSGVKFVESPDDWENHTCLILPTNVYEKIANFIWTLVKTNELRPKGERENIAIMVDCMDYLCLESDLDKEFGESRRVAGNALLTKMLWSKLALPFAAGQHLFISLSQQSAAPKIEMYAKDPIRQGGSSGGNNIQYQASTVIEFLPRYEGDYILTDPDAKYDEKKNPKIGHNVKMLLLKSDNEKYDVRLEYAVKYGRTGGNSVFVERELSNILVSWELLKRENGEKSSFMLNQELFEELKQLDKEIPEKFRSVNRIIEYLESKPEVTKLLTEKFKKLVCSGG